MIINEKRQWVVITPPKCGSNTLNKLLTMPSAGGSLLLGEDDHHNTMIPEYASGFHIYLAVRNPFARASSLYRWEHAPFRAAQLTMTFIEFVSRALLERDGHYKQWRTITEWFPQPATPIRIEWFKTHENVEGQPWIEAYHYEPDAWPMVARWARYDFKRFGSWQLQ